MKNDKTKNVSSVVIVFFVVCFCIFIFPPNISKAETIKSGKLLVLPSMVSEVPDDNPFMLGQDDPFTNMFGGDDLEHI